MDSHSRSASPRDQPRPQHRPPSPPSPSAPAFDNKAYQHDESDPNHNDSFTSNAPHQNGHSKEPNGDSKTLEAVNLELINLKPKNGKDVAVDMATNPYDEYFVPVNEHRKYMRGEKLYVTADKRSEKGGCKRPLCWTLVALVVAAVIALIVLAATGVLTTSSPTPLDQYNSTLSSARALGGLGLHDNTDHSGHDHTDHDHTAHEHDDHSDSPTDQHGPGTLSDEGRSIGSVESSDASMYVPKTVEGELKIDNEEMTAALEDPESDEYKEFVSNMSDALKKALFDRDTIENGNNEIMVEVVQLRKGSIIVTYRIHWKPRVNAVETEDVLTPSTLQSNLSNYLSQNNRMLNVYHVAEDIISARPVLDLCQLNKNGCEYGCEFDEPTLEFMCTCPPHQILDAENPKKCMSVLTNPVQSTGDDVTQKEFRVLSIDSIPSTMKTVPEEEKMDTQHIHNMEHDNVYDLKDLQPTTPQTTTENSPDLIYSHVFGNPDSKAEPEPNAEPSAEPSGEPSTEPNAEPEAEPSAEPAAEPSAEPAAEHSVEPNAEPPAEPTAEPSAKPNSKPSTEPAAEPNAELASQTNAELSAVPAAEPNAEPATEPNAEPTAEPSAEPTAEPSAEPSAEPGAEPTAEPIAEPSAGPVAEHVEDSSAAKPTAKPNAEPLAEANADLNEELAAEPKTEPTDDSNAAPTAEPSANASAEPAAELSAEPTAEPTAEPSAEPVAEHNAEPTPKPNVEPAAEPSAELGAEPTAEPIAEPTAEPSVESKSKPNSELSTESSAKPIVGSGIEQNVEPTAEPNAEPVKETESGAESKSNQASTNDLKSALESSKPPLNSEPSTDPDVELSVVPIQPSVFIEGEERTAKSTIAAETNAEPNSEAAAKPNTEANPDTSKQLAPESSVMMEQGIIDIKPSGRDSDDSTTMKVYLSESNTYNENTEITPNVNEMRNRSNEVILENSFKSLDAITVTETETDKTEPNESEMITIVPTIFDQQTSNITNMDINQLITTTSEHTKSTDNTVTENSLPEDLTDVYLDSTQYNRSSKSFDDTNNESSKLEGTADISADKNIITTESDWLTEHVTEVNYEDFNKTEYREASLMPVTTAGDLFSNDDAKDTDTDYLSNKDPITDESGKLKDEITHEDKSDENGMEKKYLEKEQTNQEINISGNKQNVTSVNPFETTTISEYIYRSADKYMEVTNQGTQNNTLIDTNNPAPVWEESEHEQNDKSTTNDQMLSSNSQINAKRIENSDNDNKNTTQTNNLNVTIYEISNHNANNSVITSTTLHSGEYDEHETEMNPFLPEVENNKSLVKKLQEGHDLEPTNLNETQNENNDESHAIHPVENNEPITNISSSSQSAPVTTTDGAIVKHGEVSATSTENSLSNEMSAKNIPEINNITVEEKENVPSFLLDTDDLNNYKEHSTEHTSIVVENNLEVDSTSPSVEADNAEDSSFLSVVPITHEDNIQISKKSYKSENIQELNDISDSPKKSDRRTFDSNKFDSVTSNEA